VETLLRAAGAPPVVSPAAATAALVRGLRAPTAYPHPVGEVGVVETHISYVLLAGEFAYKITKPVALGFLDFSTLEARRRLCEEEVRLNRRSAAALYLGVVPITGRRERPMVGGKGMPLEFAVVMRRFPEEARLERMAIAHRLAPRDIDALAEEVARFHEGARRPGTAAAFGSPDEVLGCALANFADIQAREPGLPVPRELHDWTLSEHARLRADFERRRREGFVRECHGDLHLGNIVMHEGKPVLFDCIEFNPGFRWIDVMNDVAFLAMDLRFRGYPDLAARLIDRYVERTGDYGGLRVLRFYEAYRAMVRAKVACIRAQQAPAGSVEHGEARGAFAGYRSVALGACHSTRPAVVLMHGLSGSGKTTVSSLLVEALGGVRLRSDIVRKRLHGLEPLARTHAELGAGLYDAEATERTYAALATAARDIVRAGYPSIVDAAFLAASRRRDFRDLAREEGVPFAIVDCVAPPEVLRARVAERKRRAGDASEADERVLEHQLSTAEPLAGEDAQARIPCDTTQDSSAALAAELLARALSTVRGKEACAT
jgi:aminoglycoside phosphotransferase family enzyme/predicted kinase